MPAAYSTQRVLSDGTTMLIPLTIKIIKQADVNVVGANPDGSVATLPAWSWVGPTVNTIQFVSAVPNGIQVIIKRTTQSNTMINVFTAGASFTNIAMDTDFTQLLYLTQEAVEGAALTDIFNDVDFHGHKLINLGTAVNPNDAVSLGQYQADVLGAGVAKVAAQAAASAALSSQTAAATSATNSASSATAAAGSATAAAGSATSASGSAATATTQAGLATTNGAAQVALATTQANNAAASATTAAGSATSANTTYTNFDKRFLGAKSSDPTLDNQGAALSTGALYFNTGVPEMRVYTPSATWVAAYVPGSTFILKTGDTLSGQLNTITPTADSNAANKVYVDSTFSLAPTNIVLNGDMRVDQRGAGSSGYTLGNGAANYTVDRFITLKTGTFTAFGSRIRDAPVGCPLSYTATLTSALGTLGAGDYLNIYHVVEGYNIAHGRSGTALAQPLTIGFWVKSNKTGTYSMSVNNVIAGANLRAYVTTYTILVANTWEFKTVTIPVDTTGTWNFTNIAGLGLMWPLALGSTYTTASTNTWLSGGSAWGATGTNNLTANSDFMQIADVSAAYGTLLPSKTRPLYQTVLIGCKRYYEQVPITVSASLPIYTQWNYMAEKVAVPSLTVISGSLSGGSVADKQQYGMRLATAASGSTDAVIAVSAEM